MSSQYSVLVSDASTMLIERISNSLTNHGSTSLTNHSRSASFQLSRNIREYADRRIMWITPCKRGSTSLTNQSATRGMAYLPPQPRSGLNCFAVTGLAPVYPCVSLPFTQGYQRFTPSVFNMINKVINVLHLRCLI
jgi:hypothetical protein